MVKQCNQNLLKMSSVKKISLGILAAFFVAVLFMLPTFNAGAASTAAVSISKSGGWLESAYVEWSPVTNATGYNVYYKLASASDSQYTQIDAQLVRQYPSYFRADVLGLAAGSYVVKVVPIISGSENNLVAAATQSLTVKGHTREGFAFSAQSPMKTGSGGYNNDGTVPSNAQVIYITPKTANTVTLSVITSSSGTKTTCTGLVNIMSARQKGYDKTPLIIRLIGQVKGADISGLNSSSYLQVKGCYNLTIEGVGEDATIYQWGLLVRSAHNIEIRNLGIMLFADDAISLDTDNQNIWVHNNDIFYGAPGSDADQVKGDGSCDVKGFSDYITISYNHFWDAGKASLCGMTESKEFHVTYHHNWFDHSDSRHPRIRLGTVHIYNNYFDGVSKYGVGNTSGGSAYIEANYFRNCKYPMLISQQGTDIYGDSEGTFSGEPGGMNKAYNNKVEGATRLVYHTEDATQFDAYLATSKSEQVPSTYKTLNGGTAYNNFDTASTMYSYTPDAPDSVKTVVTTYAGRVNGGDFKWTFTTADDTDYGVNTALKAAITNYVSPLVATVVPTPTATATATVKPTSTVTATVAPTPTTTATVIPTSTTTATVTPSSTPSGNTLFTDNFESGSASNWTATQGTWSVVTDGTKALAQTSTSAEGRTSAGSQSWTDYSVKASIKVENYNSNRVMLCGRYKDGNNYYAASLYKGTTLEIRKKVNGSSSTVSSKTLSIPTGSYHTVELEMVGSTIKVYVDGTLQLSATESSLKTGAAGLIAIKSVAKYDNIIVTAK
ncbi:MAG TPA: family 16 glycoside hydrolase [Bacillota bacterium]|nr:family 16 glycoside hydrolase [Bacillota bacterium]